MTRIWILAAIAAVFLGGGCVYVDAEPVASGSGGSAEGDGVANTPPSVVLEAVGGPFSPGDIVLVDASGTTDVERDPLTYAWSVVDANGDEILFDRAASGRAIEFTATREAPFEVTVRVDDGVNSPVRSTLTITTGNSAPNIVAGTCSQPDDMRLYQVSGDSLTIELGSTQTLCLDASSSTDPEWDELSYQWVVTSTPQGAADTTVGGAEFIIDLNEPGTWTGFLEVTDENGMTSSLDWWITVL